MITISGKTAFVTGAAAGIGYAIARNLGKRGAKIMLADIDEEKLKSAEQSISAEGVDVARCVCDVGDCGSV